MSTIDPRQVQLSQYQTRAEREKLLQGSPEQAVMATIWALLALMCGAVLAYAVVLNLDWLRCLVLNNKESVMRLPAVNYDSGPSILKARIISWAFTFVFIFGASFFSRMKRRSAIRYGGGYGKALRVLPAVLLGVFIVSLRAISVMTPPVSKGFTPNESVAGLVVRPKVWGTWEWIMYWEPYGAAALVLFVLLIVLVVNMVRVRKQNRTDDVIRRGVRASGIVIQVAGGNVLINNQPLLTFVVKYTDATGTERYATKKKTFPQSQIPVMNQPVLVVYDPVDPANEKSVIVEFVAADLIDQIVAEANTKTQTPVAAAVPATVSAAVPATVPPSPYPPIDPVAAYPAAGSTAANPPVADYPPTGPIVDYYQSNQRR